MKRYQEPYVAQDLAEKMVFLGGPRQVGKTTLALNLIQNGASPTHPAYLNWDDPVARRMLLQGALPSDQPLILLDEIHKYKGWRSLVKGLYDVGRVNKQFLITGSARLDYYRRGGDSLQGRYHYRRLHPLSLHELDGLHYKDALNDLLQFGGFPEPFLKGSEQHWKRWQRQRQERVVHDDLVSLEHVKDISQIDLLMQILPDRVGSLLSINNLRTDLSAAFETVDRWIGILENLYVCFRISPYGLPQLRAVKKDKKLYLWDWSLCVDPAAKFENFVASQLLKYCHFQEDNSGDRMTLSFIRDSVGREIDFVVTKNGKPLFAVECKSGDQGLSRNVTYFSERSHIPIFYQVHMGKKDYEIPASRARVLPVTTWASILGV